jgi:hypothetical protein
MSKSPEIHRVEWTANAACSIFGLISSSGKMDYGWDRDNHENERTDDCEIESQRPPLGKEDPCRHHQPNCEAGEASYTKG